MNQGERFQKLSDLELIELYQLNGDKEFVGALFVRYSHLIYGVCLKYLKEREPAKDAVMDIFESLISKLHDQEIREFGRWVHVVARNHCLMKLRKKDVLKNNTERKEIFMEYDESVHHLNEDFFNEKNLNKLENAIKELSEEQMVCIRLFYWEEKSYAEIADQTGYQLKEVKSYIQNGKRNLKNLLEKEIE